MEGLWDPNEAEGGAHIFFGPIIALDSPGRNWTFHVTAGADVRASQTARSSDALRALGQSGVLMRIGMTRVVLDIMISCVYETDTDSARRHDIQQAAAAGVPSGALHVLARSRDGRPGPGS